MPPNRESLITTIIHLIHVLSRVKCTKHNSEGKKPFIDKSRLLNSIVQDISEHIYKKEAAPADSPIKLQNILVTLSENELADGFNIILKQLRETLIVNSSEYSLGRISLRNISTIFNYSVYMVTDYFSDSNCSFTQNSEIEIDYLTNGITKGAPIISQDLYTYDALTIIIPKHVDNYNNKASITFTSNGNNPIELKYGTQEISLVMYLIEGKERKDNNYLLDLSKHTNALDNIAQALHIQSKPSRKMDIPEMAWIKDYEKRRKVVNRINRKTSIHKFHLLKNVKGNHNYGIVDNFSQFSREYK